MSKVISFSISDRYLDKLRTLYPNSTDNLAVKQFVTDRLDGSLDDALDDNLKTIIESSLSSTLDDTLDDVLDDKLKTIIETSLDGILDERLNATVGKLITSLSERIERIEERLDDSLDGSLDVKLDYGLPYQPSKNELTDTQRRVLESRQLTKAKLEHAAYLVKHPLVVRDLTKKQPIETVTDTVESVDKVESVDEPVQPAIGPVPGDSPQMKTQLCEAVTIGNRQGLTNQQLHEKTRVPVATIEKWKGKIKEGEKVKSTKYPDFFKQWSLNLDDSLWYEVD